MDRMEIETPAGNLIIEKKGRLEDFPGIYVSLDASLIACVEYDSMSKEIRTETYSNGEDFPCHIICYKDGHDLI